MKPEEIFRFVNVRPAQQPPPERITRRFASYGEGARSPFHRVLRDVTGEGARERAVELAQKRLAKDDLPAAELDVLLPAVKAAAGKDTAAEARAAVEKALDAPLEDYLAGDRAQKQKDILWDRLYAHTLVPGMIPEERAPVYAGVRALHFLGLLAQQADGDQPLSWDELTQVTPLLPKGLIPGAPSPDRGRQDRYAAEVEKQLNAVHAKVQAVNAAMDDLKNNNRVRQAQELRTVTNLSAAESPHFESLRTVRLSGPVVERPSAAAEAAPELRAVTLEVEHRVIIAPKKTPWLFEEFGRENLSKGTRAFLEARKGSLVELEFAEAVSKLEQEKYELVAGFLKTQPAEALALVRSDEKFIELTKAAAVPGLFLGPLIPLAPAAPPTPAERGIQPLGIGDLLVVKQELLRYAAGELAHVENVLKSEFKTRIHTRMRETEEVIITETEQLEETEKDLQTTERFELHKESQKTIQDQMSLEAGVSITAGYGPVSVTAHADFALSQSSTESSSTASTFAREITERSVSRIMKRAREERMRRTLERFEERNEHGFDNKDGAGHVIGVYRWVDKYYQARLINYGRRLMLEFIVPEPAAFFLHLQANQPLEGITLEKPVEPRIYGRRLEPADLNKWNVQDFIAQYTVEDVEPFPAETARVSAAFAEATGTEQNNAYAKTSEKLVVPTGYRCTDVFGELGYQGVKDSGYFLECFIAGQRWGSVTASGLEGIIPISVKGWIKAFHVNVVAICELKPETKTAWQLKTYAAIMTAYERALADYNEQVAVAQIQAGVQIEGRNPGINRKLEQDELRKGVLRLLTNNFASTRVSGVWRFDEHFNAQKASGEFGYPEFDIDEALVEGRIIQFFEQAFEWTNMTYRFYPYFWGRKGGWRATFPLTDPDPQFVDFLRAGSARVIVPVHPPYNETMLHYMATNEIWNGGEPPTLDDPLYISIVDELKADAGGDLDDELPVCADEGEYPCLADEWEVKLPTTLVYLQEDAALPDFTV